MNVDEVEVGISRRGVLKTLAAVAVLRTLGASAQERVNPPVIPGSPNPRWYGFNLLEYFSTDPDWTKYFPYKIGDEFREDDFRWMRDWGFTWARLPMDYRFWTNPANPLEIFENKLAPVDRAIRLGEKYGIHVNICLHRAPGECVLDSMDAAVTGIRVTKETTNVYTDPKAQSAFTNQWAYFAQRYKGISNTHLSFDLVNEPAKISPAPIAFTSVADLEKAFAPSRDDYARVAMATIQAIRQKDPNRLIVSDGYPFALSPIPQLVESKVVQSCHDYNPFLLTHYRNPWAGLASSPAPPPTWPLKDAQGKIVADKATLQASVQPWAGLAKQGVPIHFGELGCYNKTPTPVVYAWFNDTLDVIRELNSGWALWNFRGPFGILDSQRDGTKYKDWHGHQLDVALLELLKRKMQSA